MVANTVLREGAKCLQEAAGCRRDSAVDFEWGVGLGAFWNFTVIPMTIFLGGS